MFVGEHVFCNCYEYCYRIFVSGGTLVLPISGGTLVLPISGGTLEPPILD